MACMQSYYNHYNNITLHAFHILNSVINNSATVTTVNYMCSTSSQLCHTRITIRLCYAEDCATEESLIFDCATEESLLNFDCTTKESLFDCAIQSSHWVTACAIEELLFDCTTEESQFDCALTALYCIESLFDCTTGLTVTV